ncbi:MULTISPECIES: ABC transporter ATP-binding protein [unclassified Ruminococcus]|uniref:ABC transporter ATP-binding protein n=1 Tax=unclassified Ruminococcus TaxID=2608920 RepID=UPI00210B8C80|nr:MULTISPECIES: ABC transporter ATP-binding protein [unclassified Ruminococcus]MCQ4022461.1 ATP-binding cassette domain-containing protein [Ruminococcus sp. zg-924]MCQ4115725.1 ATP-binding cassette domain-containing protein [Ruminococcus sp. zg-921]
MIELCSVTKKFGSLAALDDISLKIDNGNVLGLVGSNGSGKSTMLRLIAGVFEADDGEILIDGEDSFENTDAKGKVFFVSDYPYFYNDSTVRNTADLYRRLYTSWSEEKYNHLCSLFPINQNQRIINMSKGMQRQAALILSLSCCPRHLLLDEIFDGLDPVIRMLVKKLIIEDVSNGMSVVIASHNLRELEDLCDHVALLHQGKVLFNNELDETKMGITKVQAAFSVPPTNADMSQFDILNANMHGQLYNMIIRGAQDEVLSKLHTLNPMFVEALPLTLEEVFIYEMEVAGYDVSNIIS